jgi:transcription elongation factor GreA
MATERIPITKEGYHSLTAELRRLKNVEMPKISKEIAVAREHGDLSENAEYDAAKDKQGLLHKRITDLEEKLARADIIDTSSLPDNRVVFGSVVVVYNIDKDHEQSFQLIGELESDPTRGKISVSSPLGRALIGKEGGEEVTVKAPGGDVHLEILEIRAPLPGE